MSQQPAPRSLSPTKPAWKVAAEEQFTVRRQRPTDARRNQDRLQQRLSAVIPARLPTLNLRPVEVSDLKRSIRLDQTHFEQKVEPVPSGAHSSVKITPHPPASVSRSPLRRPTAPTAAVSPTRDESTSSSSVETSADLGYSIPPPDLEQLYREHRTPLDTLPLELFDDDDTDPTPEYWLSLSTTKYDGRGTPARSQLFVNKEYIWSATIDSRACLSCVLSAISFPSTGPRVEF